jgi:hypothetical protein
MTRALKMTFYGWPDNDPPGAELAYPEVRGRGVAGGDGTHGNPVTAAAKTDRQGGTLSPGTLLYVAQLRKYFIVEDECASCVADQIDIWMDSDQDSGDAVLTCENTWTPDDGVAVEIDPPDGREVDTRPFFEVSTQTCRRPGS